MRTGHVPCVHIASTLALLCVRSVDGAADDVDALGTSNDTVSSVDGRLPPSFDRGSVLRDTGNSPESPTRFR